MPIACQQPVVVVVVGPRVAGAAVPAAVLSLPTAESALWVAVGMLLGPSCPAEHVISACWVLERGVMYMWH